MRAIRFQLSLNKSLPHYQLLVNIRRTRCAAAVLLASLVAIHVTACGPAVRTRQIAAAAAASAVRGNFVSTGSLSVITTQVLRMTSLQDDACTDGCYPRVKEPLGTNSIDTLYARSELALAHASRLEKQRQPSEQANLDAAQFALIGILRPECNSPVQFVCDDFKILYTSAVINLVSALKRVAWVPAALNIADGSQLVLSSATGDKEPQEYDSIVPAGLLSFEGLSNRLVRYGLGVPLSACRPRDKSLPNDVYLPRVGTCIPITAVLDFPALIESDTPRRVAELKLYNGFTTDTVRVSGREFPLAANFSAPFASLIERTRLSAYTGFIRTLYGSEELMERTGFFTVEPYTTHRIPLLFVHGLFSSPITWVDLQNDLMGDPEIRKHYQVFTYLYPTNLPILINAETFRDKLEVLKRHLAEGFASNTQPPGMVIIAHSMGGLLTKTAVVSDSDPVREYLWSSPEKLDALDADTRSLVDRLFTFRVRPYVERVIFVAVPFLGSDIADDWIGWIGRKLVGVPSFILQSAVTFPSKIRDAIRPELQDELEQQDLTSVKGLSPRNPVLLGLARALIDKCIPYHLIEGDQGLGGGVNASDGVVRFTSSHLEGAESELVVPTGHAAFAHPLAVQEIKRILHLHLTQRGKAANQCKRDGDDPFARSEQ